MISWGYAKVLIFVSRRDAEFAECIPAGYAGLLECIILNIPAKNIPSVSSADSSDQRERA